MTQQHKLQTIMVLKGKTDQKKIADNAPKVDLRVYVGTKKKRSKKDPGIEIYGDDLVTHFRLDPVNPSLERAVSKIADRDNLVTSLNIIPAFNDPDRFYDCQAQRYSRKGDKLSGLLWQCDRETIYRKKEAVQTKEGTRSRYIKCNDPCRLEDDLSKCPAGCQETGTLYFYLPKLLEYGANALCSLVLSGQFNIIELSAKIWALHDQLGGFEAMGMYQTNHRALFNLTRYTADRPHPVFQGNQRNGKTKQVPTHLVNLNIDPAWYQQYLQMQQLNEVRTNMRLKPLCPSPLRVSPQKLLHQEEVIREPAARANRTTRVLPSAQFNNSIEATPASLPFMSADKIEELRSLWHQHQWYPQGLDELLYSSYRISDRRQLYELTPERFEKLKNDLANEKIKQEFLSN